MRGELLTSQNLDKTYGQIQDIAGMRWITMSRQLLPHFLENGAGRIINLSVMLNRSLPIGLESTVIAANTAIATLTREVATDYRRRGIVANSISPRVERSLQPDGEETVASSRLADVAPAEVASIAAFLSSADARFLSASDLVVG